MRLRFPSWLPPLVVLLAAVGLRAVDPGVIESVRLATFDEYQRLKPATWTDAKVRIVDIDDESLARVGQWPWPRTKVAELLTRMGEMGAAVVAFDIVFSEEDRTSPRRVLSQWEGLARIPAIAEILATLPDNDEVLAEAMREVPSVVGFPMLPEAADRLPVEKAAWAFAGDDPIQFLRAAPGARANRPAIEQAAAGQGSFTADPDRDSLYRRAPMLFLVRPPGGEPTLYPSLSLEALRVAQGAATYIVRSSGASGETAFGEHTGINTVRIGHATIPTDRRGNLWLRDTGPVPQRVVPAWRVLAGEVPAGALDGMIAYVGASAPGLRDIRPTPLNAISPGVELHARATEQILLGEFLERPDWSNGVEILWLVVLGIGLMFALPRTGPVWCAVIGGVSVAAGVAASWIAFSRFGLLFDPVFPAAAGLALYLMGSFEAFVRTEGERRRVRGAFSFYMPPEMVARLAADPSLLRLGGESRHMTIMFTDIRGFTARAEWMDATALARFLNRFLTPMTAVIHRHRGTLDKYIGDAIMAFWNAPLDDPDHARHAAEAALEMLAELDRLNAAMTEEATTAGRSFAPIRIGIGINSGPVSVGNMGSEQRFGYTVIGDDVNLASRLETASKTYGVAIVLGENTATRLPPEFALLELDRVQVKGKGRSVTIFTLLGDAGVAAEPWFARLREFHAAMLAAYRGRDWAAASVAIERARADAGGRLDVYYDVYRARIAAWRTTPPPADWDGVEVAVEK